LKKSFFSSNIIKTPKYSRDGAEKKERKRGRKSIEKKKKERKLHESLQIKGEVNIFRGEKHFNFKNSFLYDSISPLHHTISKTFSKSLRKFS
jgi:hypothetical protein